MFRRLLIRTSPIVVAALLLVAPPSVAGARSDAGSMRCSGWRDVRSPLVPGQLFGITVLSDTDAWAVGYRDEGRRINSAVIEHWDGTRWSVIKSPQPGGYRDFLEKAAAVAPDDVWAVGAFQDVKDGTLRREHTLVEHWDGMRWTEVSTPNVKGVDNVLSDVTAISRNDVWATGIALNPDGTSRAMSEHWNGAHWTVVRTPSPGDYTNALSALTVVSSTDIWAVGSYTDGRLGLDRTLSEHWDGERWKVVPTPNVGALGDGLSGVAAVSPTDIWAAGWFGYHEPDGSLGLATMTDHWNGKRWSVIATPDPPGGDNSLHDVTALDRDDVWAVGSSTNGPIVIRWDGRQWLTQDTQGPRARWLWNVVALSRHDIWAVGSIALDFLIMRGC